MRVSRIFRFLNACIAGSLFLLTLCTARMNSDPVAEPEEPLRKCWSGRPAIFLSVWAVGGFLFLLGHGIFRLTPTATAAAFGPLTVVEAIGLAASIILLAVGEGYYAIHRFYAPRFVGRLTHLLKERDLILSALAPFVCMALLPFDRADRRNVVRGWSMVVAILLMIFLVRGAPDPWRGIIHVGVVLALLMGTVSVFVRSVMAVSRHLKTGKQDTDSAMEVSGSAAEVSRSALIPGGGENTSS